MLEYFFEFAAGLFEEMFNNPLFEIVPLTFLFVIGLKILNMIKKVA